MNDFASAPKGVSRRTVAKAMAWSVPVIAVAATAPIVSASPPKPIDFTGQGCKDPSGGSGSRYYFWLSITPEVPVGDIPFTFTSNPAMAHTGQQPGTFTAGQINNPGGVSAVLIKFTSAVNAANGFIEIKYTLNGIEYDTRVEGTYSSDCHNRVPPITPF